MSNNNGHSDEPKDKLDLPLVSVSDFAAKVRAKYPNDGYDQLDDFEVVCRFATKFPVYRDVIDWGERVPDELDELIESLPPLESYLEPIDEYEAMFRRMDAEAEAGQDNSVNDYVTEDQQSKRDDVAPFDERHGLYVDILNREFKSLLEFSLPGPNKGGIPPDVLKVKIDPVEYLRTLREMIALQKCIEPEMLNYIRRLHANPELAKSLKQKKDIDVVAEFGFSDESAMEAELSGRYFELVFDENIVQAEREAFQFFIRHLPTIMWHAYRITLGMVVHRLVGAGVFYSEGLITDKKEVCNGVSKSVLGGGVQGLIKDIKQILETPQRGGSKGWWTEKLRADFLNLYERVLKQVQKRDTQLPATVLRKADLRGNRPSDVARSYAAKLFEVPDSEYLPTVLRQARKERSNSKNAGH